METPERPDEGSHADIEMPDAPLPMATAEDGAAEADPVSSDESDVDEKKEPEDIKDATRRRRVLNAKFEALLTKRANSDCIGTTKAAPPELPEAQLSTAHLVAKRELGHGALDPREYQLELFERAKARNTIAVLDTGSGKTLIAVLLLKHVIRNELNDRAKGKPHRISFFLVDSVTLVYQQGAVLRNNIDQNIAQLFGAMGTDLWSKQTWDEHFKAHMVIVCTAEILNQCLLNSYVRINQINLLIFDEAHHTKKEHAYARIIRDSYLKESPSGRPRVFGMTASPIDARGDIVDAATKLETLLDSQIATTSNLTLLRQFIKRPTERVWTYDRLETPFTTELFKTMKDRFGDLSSLGGVFRFAWDASSELGKWCADRAWSHALADDVLPKLEGNISKAVGTEASARPPGTAYQEIARIKEASDIVKNYPSDSPDAPGSLSPKVRLLRRELGKHFETPTDTKCIVFTKTRYTAKMLFELFSELNIPYLRPGVLVGVRSSDPAGMNITFRQQFVALVKFRRGEINCLFATSVAEEGLDIPDCNLVVRFNLYRTLIQYVQSRGRARHSDSTYAALVEKENPQHQSRLVEVRDAEQIMQGFCEALPEDRLIHGSEHDLDSLLQKEESKRTYKISATGAQLTYHSAMAILARYASSLQYEKESSTQVTYITLPVASTFVCEVILPEKSPIRGQTGRPEMKKTTSKQSAAFDTCLLLRKHKLLDDHFSSIYHRRLPAMRNAKLAITSKHTNQYDVISKPSFWDNQQGNMPEKLYAILISFKPSRELTREHGNIVLLTRERLPEFPPFFIFLDEDVKTTVCLEAVQETIEISSDELDTLTNFTLRVFRDVFHKVYGKETEKMPYWLALVTRGAKLDRNTQPKSVIDWQTLSYVKDNEEIPYSDDLDPTSLVDRLVYDNWDGRFRLFTTAVDDTLRPSDPPPSFVPRRRHMDNIMSYCVSLSKNSRVKFFSKCNWNQPVFYAEMVRLRRNLLDRMSDHEKDMETKTVVCLEALRISAIPSSAATSFFAFPAIISRLDSYLITIQGCKNLDLAINPEFALEAFTKDSDNTEEHRGQQIQFQRGMGKNYERLEFLGDCFLKMATSIALFTQNPDDDEYDYHVNRMCLICNKNLFNSATKKKLYMYIRSRGFSRHTWYPGGLTLLQGKDHSKKVTSEGKHALGEKTIADVCEALIGGALLSGGPEHRFDTAVKAVTAMVDSENHTASYWKEYYSHYSLPKYQTINPDGSEVDLARNVEEKLGYRFIYPRLLQSAFTHPSYPSAWAKVPCYQRLEFLGDALLEMVCVEDLFERFPDRDPQWLTEHKMAMVSNKFLGALAVRLRLHTHLRHFSNPLQSQVTHYADEIQTAEAESEGAVDYWIATKDPPKCLPDMIEAYLGATFVDSSFNFGVIETFFQNYVKPYFRDMSIYDTFANKHPTTYLHNRMTNDFGCSNYCLKAGEFPAVDGTPAGVLAAVIVHDSVIGEGTASSGRYAKIKASEKALAVLGDMLPSDFCEKYHCNCREVNSAQDADAGTAI